MPTSTLTLTSQQKVSHFSPGSTTDTFGTSEMTTDDASSTFYVSHQSSRALSPQSKQSRGTRASTANGTPAATASSRRTSQSTSSSGGNVLSSQKLGAQYTGSKATSPHVAVSMTSNGPNTGSKAIVTLSSGRATGTTRTSHSGAPKNSVTNGCASPPSVFGAIITSSGPYIPGTSVVYACLSGLTLSGTATIMCGPDLKFIGPPPQCIEPNNRGGAGLHTGLEEELTGMPMWLAIIVGVTVGVICLFFLTCLLILCLRIFGCVKGSLFDGSARRSSAVHPEKPVLGTTRATSAVIVQDEEPRNKNVSNNTTNVGKQRQNNQFRKNYKSSLPFVNLNYDIPPTRRQAKIPEGKKWMPHTKGVRNFNTSTK